MSPLPMPVRIAAGLAATAVEQVRELPRLVAEFPVSAVSQALQVSMRVQQKVTELAIKGDKALGGLSTPPESPSWATFDEDEPADEPVVPSPSAPAPKAAAPKAAKAAAEPVTTPTNGASVTPITPSTDLAEQSLEAELDTPPAVLPGYPAMTLPQLRGKLRALTLPDLQALLIWETAHENRPPFVTMLSNRITTVREG